MLNQPAQYACNKESDPGILHPILVAGGGRSGTTLLMQLLSTDERCAFDRNYPMESPYLSYFLYFTELFGGRDIFHTFDIEGGVESLDSTLSQFPVFQTGRQEANYLIPPLDTNEMFMRLWSLLSETVKAQQPNAFYYAEKVAMWVPLRLMNKLSFYTIYSIRDPRDVYLSTNAVIAKHNRFVFMRKPTDSDLQHAMKLASRFLASLENYKAHSSLLNYQNCLAMKYEELVADPELAFRPIHNALGIKINPQDTDRFYENHRTSNDKASSIYRWMKEGIAEDIRQLFEMNLAEELLEFGYPVEESRAPLSKLQYNFATESDKSMITDISGGELIECNNRGLLFSAKERTCVMHIKVDVAVAGLQEIWLCIAGDLADSYELKWRQAGTTYTPVNSSIQRRVTGDHYRVVQFSMPKYFPCAENLIELKLSFNCETTAMMQYRKSGWLKWIRCVAISPELVCSSSTEAPVCIGFSEAHTIQKQAAHITLLTEEFHRLTDLTDRLQRHISHLEHECAVYKARFDKLTGFIPWRALRNLKILRHK